MASVASELPAWGGNDVGLCCWLGENVTSFLSVRQKYGSSGR